MHIIRAIIEEVSDDDFWLGYPGDHQLSISCHVAMVTDNRHYGKFVEAHAVSLYSHMF